MTGPRASRVVDYLPGETLFSQGDPADVVLYVLEGRLTLSVLSPTGREAVVEIVNGGEYLGEEALAGQSVRRVTATALTSCRVRVVPKGEMIRLLHQEQTATDRFIAHVLARNRRLQEALVDQMFNACEKRLARVLIELTRHSGGDPLRCVMPPIPQEVLAEMVGTTRPRVNIFMNEFRRRGFIDYDNHSLTVHAIRLTAMLQDSAAQELDAEEQSRRAS
jgi:CRP/FNR family cyclic AMP-dependent transcriptional regulator